jgi:hypothetical protein
MNMIRFKGSVYYRILTRNALMVFCGLKTH